MDEQITLFDETPENTSQNPFECPFAPDVCPLYKEAKEKTNG